ncbi:SAM-dependent DNA methyltransferase [candidate division KSB3 bacterium]|uniref:SAM-dependent DNA methyltransferase n=1 Tax=candidate division KSB3 bacterium TaxID=2044937 RepID=A0A9D5JY05_9BACT|nr:SAM-dependent DNA methyltransferase [candidate division KSB3 bacterium]MBD3326387.1 SAM-dependent DNA methyltransferase [candidate division KSB3 bacterium]
MTRKQQVEYGDFQTPAFLAEHIVMFLKKEGINPDVIVEPTCGLGSFIKAAIKEFGPHPLYYGFDLNAAYLKQVKESISRTHFRLHLACQNFFQQDWPMFFDNFTSHNILVIGNPPWVTNATLGAIGSVNIPTKTNLQGYRGFHAKTGKANFDIAEWMLIKLIESLQKNSGCLAMLCKIATARKVLQYAWKREMKISHSSLHTINAKTHFDASVNACLFVTHVGQSCQTRDATVYSGLHFTDRLYRFGMYGKDLIADLDAYDQLKDIDGIAYYTWRSGVKHDAVKVMEFTKYGHLINGFGESVDIEQEYVFPLLKSSDIGNHRLIPRKYVLLPQKHIGDDTQEIKIYAPKTWNYLLRYADILDKRKSSIYIKRPRFSIFGVGEYSFAPWKVTISGLYKHMQFVVIGNFQGKPIMVDDTCYFIPCFSEDEAFFVSNLLNSERCQRFLQSLVFWDAKRPITKEILQRIDLKKLAEYSHLEEQAYKYLTCTQISFTGQSSFVFDRKGLY